MTDHKRAGNYYDEEAGVYSLKRYPKVPVNYVQFLFTHRREVMFRLLQTVIANTAAPRTLLEIGTADGVLLRSIAKRIPDAFAKITGSDISQEMVATAGELTHNPHITFVQRDSLAAGGDFICVLEIGVGALATDTQSELSRAAGHLASGGYYICTFAGRNSIATRWGSTAADISQLSPYKTYEAAMREYFTIKKKIPYGIYVPLLWKAPALARRLQPLAEVAGKLFPSLAHEQLYLLKKK
jgi:hypothetical protein